MRRIQVLLAATVMLTAASCKKNSPERDIPSEQMEYFNFNDREIRPNAGFLVDINHDGRNDFAFTTLLVGDPVNQVDKLQFLILSNIGINLPVNNSEELPVMNKGDLISPDNFNGFQWFELASIVLVQKITSFTALPLWEGHWRNASHKYLPFQVMQEGKLYNGWFELSVDIIGEKIVIHKGGISKEANKIVKAGD